MEQERCESRERLLKQLLAAEEERAMGRMGCTLEEMERFLDEILDQS